MSRLSKNTLRTPGATELLELCEGLPAFSLAGFEVTKRAAKVHLGAIPSDPRSDTAGLMGIRAPQSWSAIAIKIVGDAHQIDSGDAVGGAESAVVVCRNGETASYLDVDGERLVGRFRPEGESCTTAGGPNDDPAVASPGAGVQGAIVDSLHRILGLPSPGSPVDPASMVLGLWFDDILASLFIEGTISWTRVALLHGLAAIDTAIPPSEEMLVEATFRASNQLNWDRLRNRAIKRGEPSGGLSVAEMRWMDATMFSRWVYRSFPDLGDVADAMVTAGCEEGAERLLRVVGEVRSRQIQMSDEQLPRSA